ncbi:MAG: hypothetical protein PUE86_07740 [Prevotella sp.]|nr:hypothetical protein [Prevotella sp.]
MAMNVKQCFKIRHVGSCVLDLLITCLLFALGFSDAHAEGDGLQDENKEWALEVKLIDGQTVVWPIAKMPVTTFSADSVTMSPNKNKQKMLIVNYGKQVDRDMLVSMDVVLLCDFAIANPCVVEI